MGGASTWCRLGASSLNNDRRWAAKCFPTNLHNLLPAQRNVACWLFRIWSYATALWKRLQSYARLRLRLRPWLWLSWVAKTEYIPGWSNTTVASTKRRWQNSATSLRLSQHTILDPKGCRDPKGPKGILDPKTREKGNIMKPYIQDMPHGHAASPINNTLSGLFFSCKTLNGSLPHFACFGDRRLSVPANRLLNPSEINMYFCDYHFWDYYIQPHHVTIVVAKCGSEADRFCTQKLHKLDVFDNPFLCIRHNESRPADYEYWYWYEDNLCVEVFYTEDVDITGIALEGEQNNRFRAQQQNVNENRPLQSDDTSIFNLVVTSEEDVYDYINYILHILIIFVVLYYFVNYGM